VDLQDLQRASFRGVPFLVSSTGLTGGRRQVLKRFPNSDRQALEDLGRTPREFSISGIIAAQRDAAGGVIRDYREVRNALVNALEERGPGVLVHPFLGKFNSVGVMSFSLTEDMTRLGDATIEMTFAVDDADALPQATESVVGSVSNGADAVTSAAEADIGDRFEVTETFPGNFSDAIAKATDIATQVRGAIQVSAATASEIDSFDASLTGFEDDVVDLVNDPDLLGQDGVALVTGIRGIYGSSTDAFRSLEKLFGYGDDDVRILPTTAGRIERQRNRDILNSNVQATALAQAYLSAAETEYDNTDAIDSVSERLEAQWTKLLAADTMSDDTEEALAKLRVTSNRFFDEQRDLRPQVVEVRTDLTSARLLSFSYYGSSDQGDTLTKLNDFDDPSAIEGTVKVLSS